MEDYQIILLVILGIILIIGGFSMMVIKMSEVECLRSYENYQPQWGFFESCRIMVDGKLTPVDIVRELN